MACNNAAGMGFVGLPRNQLLSIPHALAALSSTIFPGLLRKRAWIMRPPIFSAHQCCYICQVLFFAVSNVGVVYTAYMYDEQQHSSRTATHINGS